MLNWNPCLYLYCGIESDTLHRHKEILGMLIALALYVGTPQIKWLMVS